MLATEAFGVEDDVDEDVVDAVPLSCTVGTGPFVLFLRDASAVPVGGKAAGTCPATLIGATRLGKSKNDPSLSQVNDLKLT